VNDHAETNSIEPPDVRPETVEGGEAERSAFAVHRDPSLTTTAGDRSSRVGRGIAWVRPTDLIASSTARIAGRGINFQAELAHRAHRTLGQAYRATRNEVRGIRDRRAERTAPEEPSGFDVFEPQDRQRSSSWVRPSGIGRG
jgi:hypothetical protein